VSDYHCTCEGRGCAECCGGGWDGPNPLGRQSRLAESERQRGELRARLDAEREEHRAEAERLRSEHSADLVDARKEVDSMKTWSVALFAHVCRLTGKDPKKANLEIAAIAASHEAAHRAEVSDLAQQVTTLTRERDDLRDALERETACRLSWVETAVRRQGEVRDLRATAEPPSGAAKVLAQVERLVRDFRGGE